MKLKGIIDYDCTNYKKPTLTLEFPYCDFKCDKLNNCQVCQNNSLKYEPNITISLEKIWDLYIQNPLTKGFCCQGLEPFDSPEELGQFITFIRKEKKCNDDIIIYTGYDAKEKPLFKSSVEQLNYKNIIVKWGRFIINQKPHYDAILGVNLASDNQYAEKINYEDTCNT